MTAVTYKLTAILAADVVSRMTNADENRTLARLRLVAERRLGDLIEFFSTSQEGRTKIR